MQPRARPPERVLGRGLVLSVAFADLALWGLRGSDLRLCLAVAPSEGSGTDLCPRDGAP